MFDAARAAKSLRSGVKDEDNRNISSQQFRPVSLASADAVINHVSYNGQGNVEVTENAAAVQDDDQPSLRVGVPRKLERGFNIWEFFCVLNQDWCVLPINTVAPNPSPGGGGGGGGSSCTCPTTPSIVLIGDLLVLTNFLGAGFSPALPDCLRLQPNNLAFLKEIICSCSDAFIIIDESRSIGYSNGFGDDLAPLLPTTPTRLSAGQSLTSVDLASHQTLIVVLPTGRYSCPEVNLIREFVRNGGRLILIYDDQGYNQRGPIQVFINGLLIILGSTLRVRFGNADLVSTNTTLEAATDATIMSTSFSSTSGPFCHGIGGNIESVGAADTVVATYVDNPAEALILAGDATVPQDVTGCLRRAGMSRTWNGHRTAAINQGCQLASILNPAEQAVLQALLVDNGGRHWLGGERRRPIIRPFADGPSEWRWIDGSPFCYTNFAATQPDNLGGNQRGLSTLLPLRFWADETKSTVLPAVYKCPDTPGQAPRICPPPPPP